jgi:hypothetical protein
MFLIFTYKLSEIYASGIPPDPTQIGFVFVKLRPGFPFLDRVHKRIPCRAPERTRAPDRVPIGSRACSRVHGKCREGRNAPPQGRCGCRRGVVRVWTARQDVRAGPRVPPACREYIQVLLGDEFRAPWCGSALLVTLPGADQHLLHRNAQRGGGGRRRRCVTERGGRRGNEGLREGCTFPLNERRWSRRKGARAAKQRNVGYGGAHLS